MKACSIVIKNDSVSEQGYNVLVDSSVKINNSFTINKFNAITPESVDKVMKANNLIWNYPWTGSIVDFGSGLIKTSYKTANPKARIACSLSHFLLWKQCYQDNINYLILEHDAVFHNKIDFDINHTTYDILGINNPINATRKSKLFYDIISSNNDFIQPVPWIDDIKVPQGLAGNSAYIIKPRGAETLIDLVYYYGLWPNDAIMCRQLVPNIGVTKKFYTSVQRLKSTTVN